MLNPTNIAVGASHENNDRNCTRSDRAVNEKLRLLEAMDYSALRDEWRRLYRSQPPKRVARELLLLGIAWKVQEKAYGGHSAAIRRRLANLSNALGEGSDIRQSRTAQLKPGAKLIREWHGRSHTVIALEDGFEWQGERWRSLSVIARKITGTRWSGPRFFGLVNAPCSVHLAQVTDGGPDNA
jgi:hypothetical protein